MISRMIEYLLLVMSIACPGTISCRMPDSSADVEKPSVRTSEELGQRRSDKEPSREEITRVVIDYLGSSSAYMITYDEENTLWREFATSQLWQSTGRDEMGHLVYPKVDADELEDAIGQRWPVLKGRNYQAVPYKPRPMGGVPGRDDGRWMLIDRDTCKVLVVLNAWGWTVDREG